ncbi:hypothetical protein FB45DRAFT_915959 [Roridomyces roridus]|uniref:Uncharacterized protein n=1 Tax=Roridomyces roridus TaxID=1738132 RepID=A0AAD7BUT7_9AGAR|nr:hypothetical protein FB45DRAFT_915959 [Roridomyces roridus]
MSRSWALLALCLAANLARATDSLGFLDQTFYFSYDDPNRAVQVPVTTQCDTIRISWQRGQGVGASPVAPYYLQIYTSAFVFPFVVPAGNGLSFDWEVPFGPGTLYQICMVCCKSPLPSCLFIRLKVRFQREFRRLRNVYTVIANTSATPSCTNATFPLGPLDVEGAVNIGPLSQYAWIDECTDIQVTPKNGTPPYTFTVAPALHPPHNTTGKDQSPMNWTVNLSWGSVFFISVVDADMNFWSFGPLHSGQGSGDLSCLSGTSRASKELSPGVAAASGFGGLLLGLIIGGVATYLFFRFRRRRFGETPLLNSSYGLEANPYNVYGPSHAYEALPLGNTKEPSSTSHSPFSGDIALHRMQRESSGYQVEPTERPRQPSASSDTASTSGGGGGNVYVVHQDGGRPPVTVYHQEGTAVVELPPRYATPATDRARPDSTARRSSPGGSLTPQSAQELIAPRRLPNRPAKP